MQVRPGNLFANNQKIVMRFLGHPKQQSVVGCFQTLRNKLFRDDETWVFEKTNMPLQAPEMGVCYVVYPTSRDCNGLFLLTFLKSSWSNEANPASQNAEHI